MPKDLYWHIPATWRRQGKCYVGQQIWLGRRSDGTRKHFTKRMRRCGKACSEIRPRHGSDLGMRLSFQKAGMWDMKLPSRLLFREILPDPKRFRDDLSRRFPEDTRVQFTYVPTLRALPALNHNDPSKAIELLQTAILYEDGSSTKGGSELLLGAGNLWGPRGAKRACGR